MRVTEPMGPLRRFPASLDVVARPPRSRGAGHARRRHLPSPREREPVAGPRCAEVTRSCIHRRSLWQAPWHRKYEREGSAWFRFKLPACFEHWQRRACTGELARSARARFATPQLRREQYKPHAAAV